MASSHRRGRGVTNPEGVAILGSTGSIGVSTLSVVSRHPRRFRIVALAARSAVEKMAAQCARFRPEFAALADPGAAAELRHRLRDTETTVLAGGAALEEVVTLPQVRHVLAGIVGAAGLLPTLAAARAGKRVLLANKEALVMAGRIFMDSVREGGAELIPIDSEHNAIFQCLPAPSARARVRRILLTASGGPFRGFSVGELESVTPEAACAHPNWEMGPKISVDSATMMNKALEVIEACWLFETVPDRIEVVIHPQSTVHSMVEYEDGAILAQLGAPDMRTPIAHALAWPDRIESGAAPLDFSRPMRLEFEPPDRPWEPCIHLGYRAARAGGTLPAVLNAANEVAVAAFLAGRTGFNHIYPVVEETLSRRAPREANDLATILDEDAAAREIAAGLIG